MKLSIITINRNNSKGLQTTIDSVIPRLNNRIEYIIIDGNSTDNSVDIIKKNAAKLNYWISESDLGVYNAMNKGIRQANGEYLLFMNSGDYIKPEVKFDNILQELDSDEDIIYFNVEFVGEKSSFIRQYPDILDFKHLALDSINHQATFIKKQPLLEYGCYDEQIKIVADWAYFIDAVCKRRATFKHVDTHFSSFIADGLSTLPQYRSLALKEIHDYLDKEYYAYMGLLKEWKNYRKEISILKSSRAIKYLKKIGLLSWFDVY